MISDITEEQTRFRSGFDLFDEDGEGKIGRTDLESILPMFSIKYKEEEMDNWMKELGDEDGNIDYESFVRIMKHSKDDEKEEQSLILNEDETKLSEEEKKLFQEAFEHFDEDKDGFLVYEELVQATIIMYPLYLVKYITMENWLKRYKPTNEEVDGIYQKNNINKEEKIGFDNFCTLVTTTIEKVTNQKWADFMDVLDAHQKDRDLQFRKNEVQKRRIMATVIMNICVCCLVILCPLCCLCLLPCLWCIACFPLVLIYLSGYTKDPFAVPDFDDDEEETKEKDVGDATPDETQPLLLD